MRKSSSGTFYDPIIHVREGRIFSFHWVTSVYIFTTGRKSKFFNESLCLRTSGLVEDCRYRVDTAPWQRILSTTHRKILNSSENSKAFFGNSHSRMSLLLHTADTNKFFGLYLSSVLNGGRELSDKLATSRKKNRSLQR